MPKKTLEEKEYDKVCEMIDKKEDKKLAKWLSKFSEKGAFWIGDEKNKKEDWL